jgi:uncharacterized membrane protein YfcA
MMNTASKIVVGIPLVAGLASILYYQDHRMQVPAVVAMLCLCISGWFLCALCLFAFESGRLALGFLLFLSTLLIAYSALIHWWMDWFVQ